MSKRQRIPSTANPLMAKSITNFFQWNTAKTSDGVVEPVCVEDPAVVKLGFRIMNCGILLAMNVVTNKL